MNAQVQTQGLDIRPLPGGLGAEIRGVDLSAPLATPVLEAIKDAFERCHLLIAHGQSLGDPAMLDFALVFGEVEDHLNYRAEGDKRPPPIHSVTNLDAAGKPSENPVNNENFYWHTDKAYRAHGALLTMLHAVELPPTGGNTEFADMAAAYAALPRETRERIDDLQVVHSWRRMREKFSHRPLTEEEERAFPDVVHPLVQRHPVSGQKSLYLGMYAARVVGMPEDVGRKLLDDLEAHATRREFVYAHQWRLGDVVAWDNRCLLHRAARDYDLGGHRRILRRVVVQGARA